MPNWCYCEMAIYGAKENVERLAVDLRTAKEQAKELGNWDLYQIFEVCGKYKKDEILSGDLDYIRGTIEQEDFVVEDNDEESYMYIYYESAWGPMIEGWNRILEKYNLKQVTSAEECGNQVYINTDIECKFFSHKYILDIEYQGDAYREYFDVYIDLISYCERLFKVKLKGLNFEDLQEKVEELVEEDNEDNCFVLEEFCED